MKSKVIVIVALVMMLASISMAQMADKAEINAAKTDYLGLKPASKPFSLIDLSRIKWFNSYSLSFFSGGGTSGSVGLYNTALLYELSPSLSIGMKLGIIHNPSILYDRKASADAAFLPGFQLDYHPSSKFRFSIGFDTVPLGYGVYGPYYDELLWR